MGRPKGSGNRTPQQQAFVNKVERFLRASDPKTYTESDSLARLTCRILADEKTDNKTKALLVIGLLKYKVGLPIQPIEHSGEIGMADRVAAMRKRVTEGARHDR